MTRAEARRLVAALVAHYPRDTFTQANAEAYTHALARYEYEAGNAAVQAVLQREDRLPSWALIAQAYATAAVGAPAPAVAWEQVQALCSWRPQMVPCPVCGGTGDATGRDGACSDCHGVGDVPSTVAPYIHPVARRAMDSLGGAYTVRTSDNPGMLRAQFIRAYDDFLRLCMEHAALGGAWEAALVLGTAPQQIGGRGPMLVQQGQLSD